MWYCTEVRMRGVALAMCARLYVLEQTSTYKATELTKPLRALCTPAALIPAGTCLRTLSHPNLQRNHNAIKISTPFLCFLPGW